MKTAGQTICDILRNSFPAQHCDLRVGELATTGDLRFTKVFYPKLSSIAGHSVRPRGDLLKCEGIRFFAMLREPISRCISHFQFERNRNGRQVDLESWLEQNRDYQTKILCGTRNPDEAVQVLEEHVGFVGLVEDFDQSLYLWRNWSGFDLQIQSYQSRNIAGNKSIANELRSDPKAMAAIHEANEGDSAVYRYVREVIFPRMVAKYSEESELIRQRNLTSLSMWSHIKRNLAYKPVAKIRQRMVRQRMVHQRVAKAA